MMPNARLPNADFWQDRRVLVTGHTGFKGSWMARWLAVLGARATGLALPPATTPNLFEIGRIAEDCDHNICDLAACAATEAIIAKCRPQIIVHLAAQALVRQSYRDPLATVATNVLGTAHLLQAARQVEGIRVVLVVTSDKVYANDESRRALKEEDRLGGHDPYAASKAACEIIARSMADSFLEPSGTRVATARGGNVIGGGDFSDDRIVPDIWRAARSGRPLVLRQPQAVRPWQHVLDCLAGYLVYAEALAEDSSLPRTLNIGPLDGEHMTVGELAQTLLRELKASEGWRIDSIGQPREMKHLSIDPTLSRKLLGITDRWPGRDGLEKTAEWYRRFDLGEDPRTLMTEQIAAYGRVSDRP